MNPRQTAIILALTFITIIIGIYSLTFGELSLVEYFNPVPTPQPTTTPFPTPTGVPLIEKFEEIVSKKDTQSTASSELESIKETINLGDTFLCTYTSDVLSMRLYVSGDSAHFSRISQDGSPSGNAILRDSAIFVWEEDATTGFSYSSQDLASVDSLLDLVDQEDTDMTALIQNCAVSTVNTAEFTLPTNIEFTSFNLDELLGSFGL